MKAIPLFRRMRRGFDLLQISLGTITLLGGMGASLVLYNSIAANNQTMDMTRTALVVSTEIQSLYANKRNYNNLNNNTLIAQSGISPSMLSNIVIDAPGGDPQAFRVFFDNVRATSCARIEGNPASVGPNASIDCDLRRGETDLWITYSR